MIKILLKKELKEFLSPIVINRKTNKPRSRAALFALAALLLVAAAATGASFYFLCMFFSEITLAFGLDWLYFVLVAVLSLMIGVIINVFATFNALFSAKDNDLLISMPLKPSQILSARMISLYLLGTLFTAIVWVPGLIRYWIAGSPSFLSVVFGILLLFVVSAFVLVISCLLGWVVGLITSRLRNKAVFTTILYFLLFGLYYVVYFKMSDILRNLAENIDSFERSMSGYLNPFYLIGKAAAGDVLCMIIIFCLAAAVTAVCIFVLSRSFIKISTSNKGAKKKAYDKEDNSFKKPESALFAKESKRFFGTPIYLFNSGLGVILMIVLAVIVIVKSNDIVAFLHMLDVTVPWLGDGMSVILGVIGMMLISTIAISAPSVSLEGNTLWILKTLPISEKQIFSAKLKLHIMMNTIALIALLAAVAIAFRPELPEMIVLSAFLIIYMLFEAYLGLVTGLTHPVLDWSNETVPVKQSMGVLICMLGGWGIAALVAGLYAVLFICLEISFITPILYLAIWTVIIGLLVLYMEKWLGTKGAKKFREL